jgi:soluble lytic murein transglycosylase-like protein
MRRLTLLIALSAACAAAFGQSVASYVKLRNKQHIVQPTSADALNSLIGTKIVEIQGLVTGSLRSGDSISLMVQLDDDQTQVVDCSEAPPEWLDNGNVSARLLVHVSRSAEYDPLTATLISAAPEDPIKKLDDAYWKKEAIKSPAPSRPQSLASRSGGDLHGWIGHPPAILASSADSRLPTSPYTPQYAAFICQWNRRIPPQLAGKIAAEVVGWSMEIGVDARLVMAVLMAESDFNPGSYSNKGAQGLGQLMPDTARELGIRNPWDTNENVRGMVLLLRSHLNNYVAQGKSPQEALTLALAAYNAGPGAVKRAGGIPPYRETQAYVVKVVDYFNQLTAGDAR